MINELVDIIEKPGKEFIDQQYKQFSQQLKRKAEEYFNYYNQVNQQLKRIKQILIKEENALQGVAKSDISAASQYRKAIQERRLQQKDYRQELVTKSLQFQNFLNELLEQQVVLLYVYEDEEGNPSLTTINSNDLPNILHYESSHGKVTGRFREYYNNFTQHLQKLKDVELSDDFNLEAFNYTYKEVIWRYNYSKSKLVLWLLDPGNENSRWGKAKVAAAGDIKEAYASVILNRSINSVNTFNADFLDINVGSFMKEVAKVDSESGLLKGDVVIGNVHYAVKGSDAATLGLHQIFSLAQEITKKDTYSIQDLQNKKQEFHQKAKTRNRIETLVAKKGNEMLGNLADQIIKLNQMDMNSLIKLGFNKMHPKDLT